MKDYMKRIHSKNYLSKMPCFHTKMPLKSAPEKLNSVMEKGTIKLL